MARMLGPADYGILAVLMSTLYVFNIPGETIQTIVSKYATKFGLKEKKGEIKEFLFKSLKKGSKTALVCFILYLIFSIFLSFYLKIDFSLFVFTGIFIFIVFLIPINRGILQGQKKFKLLGFSMVLEGLLKLGVGLLLVFIGLKVYGALGGMIIAAFISFIVGFWFIKDIIKSKRKKIRINNIYQQNLPFLLVVLSIVLMYSLDVIFAKRFFPEKIVGQYAFIALIGKAIFFVTHGISKAMFPLVEESYENGKESSKTLAKAIFIVSALSLCALVIYGLFPEMLVYALSFGSFEYVEMAGILLFVGIAFTFLSITNVILLYSLSAQRMKRAYILPLFPIIQVILFYLFHSSIFEFSIALLISNLLFLIYSWRLR
jgi:O-antigen/teichoic acid export membrane protein